MRRIVQWIAISVLTAIAMPPAWAEMSAVESALYEAAKAEAPAVWYTSHYPTETAEKVTAAFSVKYPGLAVNVNRVTAQVAYQRVQQELAANQLQVDIYGTSDIGQYLEMRDAGNLAKYTPEDIDNVIDIYKDPAPDDYFVNTHSVFLVIVYNNEKVKQEDAPKSWSDLIDPKWKDQVALAHPGFSGTAGVWLIAMKQLFGEDFIQKLADNGPHVGRSAYDPITNVVSGERMVGVALLDSALAAVADGNPISIVYPEEGTVITKTYSSIMADSDSPNTSRLFVNFLLGTEVGEIVTQIYGVSPNPDVAPLPGGVNPEELRIVGSTPEEIVEGMTEVVNQFRDAFGI